MDKITVALGVGNQIGTAELSLDQAIADASKLLADMIQARQTLRFSADLGDSAIAKVSQAIATLSEARTSLVAAHVDLHEVKLRLGIRTRLDTFVPSVNAESEAPAPTLRQVS